MTPPRFRLPRRRRRHSASADEAEYLDLLKRKRSHVEQISKGLEMLAAGIFGLFTADIDATIHQIENPPELPTFLVDRPSPAELLAACEEVDQLEAQVNAMKAAGESEGVPEQLRPLLTMGLPMLSRMHREAVERRDRIQKFLEQDEPDEGNETPAPEAHTTGREAGEPGEAGAVNSAD